MDLSWLKWPLIILAVVGALWLLSSGGTAYMYNRFSADPGEDEVLARRYESGLTNLGNFLLKTLRYEEAEEVIRSAVEKYPNGKNVYLNWYRLAKLAEKRGAYEESVRILEGLMREDANAFDKRVPPYDNLRLRADSLIETHDLR